MARHNEIGDIGEKIAVAFLKKRGYRVVTQNYRKAQGEIDIVAQYRGVLHFLEVKTISREMFSRENNTQEAYHPSENMHAKKLQRLHRAITSYISEFNVRKRWQLDLVTVVLYVKDKKAECELFENVL